MKRKAFIIPLLFVVALTAMAETTLIIQPLTGNEQSNTLAQQTMIGAYIAP